MKTTIFTLICAAALLYSCQPKKQRPVIETTIETPPTETGIGRLREIHMNNKITVAKETYNYKYDFVSDESLPVVRNPQGDDYYDNKVTLSIKHGGKEIFNRTFTKNDFARLVPKQFMENSALVGFTYNYTKSETIDSLFFVATVGDPDETADMVFPIQLRISKNGQMTMEKAMGLDTEPLNPMTVDPDIDGGV